MKKLIVSFLLGSLITFLIVLTIPVYFHYQKQNILKEDSLSLMLETDFLSKEYEKSGSNKWPDGEYVFNAKLSKCENGSKLEWNEKTSSIKMITDKTDKCYVYFDKSKTFTYTGAEQTFTVPEDGIYKIELWGASGGDISQYKGGKGAYTKGEIYLSKGENIYIYVGELGKIEKNYEIYNGGGNVTLMYGGTGGGATDVRLDNGNWDEFDSLKSRIMVAAGGGGANNRGIGFGAGNGGAGGALIGIDGESDEKAYTGTDGSIWGYSYGKGGNQVTGGDTIASEAGKMKEDWLFLKRKKGEFGIGGSECQSGGGAGYYGGGPSVHGSAGGGSSYISGYEGCVAIQEESTEDNVMPKENCNDGTKDISCSYHYSGKIFTDANMIAGNAEMPNPLGGTEIGHSGDGYARITLIS